MLTKIATFYVIFKRPSSDGTYYGMAMSIRPSVRLGLRHSCPHFSHTCFVILSWNFVWHFLLINIRLCSSVVNFRQCLFWYSESWKYTVFHIFLLHAFTQLAEISHMPLLYCTTDYARVSSICVNFCRSYAPFGTYNTRNTQFCALFTYMLWHIELKVCI